MKKCLSGVTCWLPTNPQNSRPILKSLDDSACQLKTTLRKYRSRKREAFSKCATAVITQQGKCCKPEQSIFTLRAHLVCQHITISMGLVPPELHSKSSPSPEIFILLDTSKLLPKYLSFFFSISSKRTSKSII